MINDILGLEEESDKQNEFFSLTAIDEIEGENSQKQKVLNPIIAEKRRVRSRIDHRQLRDLKQV